MAFAMAVLRQIPIYRTVYQCFTAPVILSEGVAEVEGSTHLRPVSQRFSA
jgi:hypothetical protein